MRDHQRKACGGHRNQRCRPINNCAHRGIASANDLVIGDDRTEPVREIDNFRSSNTWEKVLVAAGKAYNFVEKHRPANNDVVIVEDQFIESDRHILRHLAIGYFCYLGGGDAAEVGKGSRVFPVMIKNVGVAGLTVDHSVAHEFAELLVAHGRVRAQRNQIIQDLHTWPQYFLEKRKHQRHGHGSRAVRNKDDHAFAIEFPRLERLGNDLAHIVSGEVRIFLSSTDRRCSSFFSLWSCVRHGYRFHGGIDGKSLSNSEISSFSYAPANSPARNFLKPSL